MDAEFFKGNRARLRELFTGTAPIVLTANGTLQRSVDSPFPFKQDGSFWYLTGINVPDIILVMDKGREYLIIPKLSASREAFDGAINIEALQKISGISEVLLAEEGWARLGIRLKRVQSVAILPPPPAYIEQLGIYTNPARRVLSRMIKQIKLDITMLDLRNHLQQMRMVKQPAELEMIEVAVNITTKSLKKIQRKFNTGRYNNEFDIELDLTREFIRLGAAGHSFSPIVAAGTRGSQIHPVGNLGQIYANDPVLLDVGAEHQHYAADLTRTWSRNPSKRFQKVHGSVLEVQAFAQSLLRPGILLHEYENEIEKFMGEKLRELGLIKTVEREAIRKYYPHTTSHFLGVDVHDAGDPERPLESGVVLTVEPGIYIPEEGIGIRIEDDVVITEKSSRVISAGLPRSLS